MRHNTLLGFLALGTLAPAFLMAACGPTEGVLLPDAGADARIDAPDVALDAGSDAADPIATKCDQLFEAALAMANRCGERAGMQISGKAYNPSSRANYVRSCIAQASAPGYDVTRVDACLAEAKVTTECVDFLELEASLPPNFYYGGPRTLYECLQRPGKLEGGQACAYDSQCASLECRKGGGAKNGPEYCGTCAQGTATVPPASPAGGPCTQGQRCASGAACSGSFCVGPAKQGEPCAAASCGAGLACTDAPGDGTDTCQPRSALGGPCSPAYCQSRLTCSAFTCVNAVIGKLGDDCSFNLKPEVQCDEDLTCESVGGGEKRQCVTLLSRFSQLGEPCNVQGKMGCDRTLWCDQGTCQPREAARCALPADAGTDAAAATDGAAE